ncbi:MAG: hypothetical protein Q8L29_02540 [archaeon]|nr:hypothetical protein [archaeon]
MEIDIRKKYEVSAKKIKNPKGGLDHLAVLVFQLIDGKKVEIGEYRRNYPDLFNTFVPFTYDDKDYALYSPDYTCTRVMELPSCKDLGGEKPSKDGFCPVDFHIPLLRRVSFPDSDDKSKTLDCWLADDKCFDEDKLKGASSRGFIRSADIGFVAGCYWGEDRLWKIQLLNISHPAYGIIEREEKFGYIELPRGMMLKNAIDMSNWEPTLQIIGIARVSWQDLKQKPVEQKPF